MPDPTFDLQKTLQNLSPEAQARVQSAVKDAVSRELVSSQGTVSDASAFSRGWVFSRVSSHNLEQDMLTNMATMSDQQYSAFSQRLAQLKGAKPGGQ